MGVDEISAVLMSTNVTTIYIFVSDQTFEKKMYTHLNISFTKQKCGKRALSHREG